MAYYMERELNAIIQRFRKLDDDKLAPIPEVAQQLLNDAHKALYDLLFDNLAMSDERCKTHEVATFGEAVGWAHVVISQLQNAINLHRPEAAINAYTLLCERQRSVPAGGWE